MGCLLVAISLRTGWGERFCWLTVVSESELIVAIWMFIKDASARSKIDPVAFGKTDPC